MSNKEILVKSSIRSFIGFFIFIYCFSAVIDSILILFAPDWVQLGNIFLYSFSTSLLFTAFTSYFLNKKINLSHNTNAESFSSTKIKFNKDKEELKSLLKQIFTNSYIQEGDNYIKIFNYKYYHLDTLIFITFEGDELFITTRPIFSETAIYNSPNQMNLIKALVK